MPEDQIVTKQICSRCEGHRFEPGGGRRACSKCGGTGETHSTMSMKEMAERVQKEMNRDSR
jgi:DnaJ-class molecular chaperone